MSSVRVLHSWCFVLAILVAALSGTAAAAAIDTPSKHAFMVDLTTGAVLLEKNADAPMAPASMSKLMTIYMVFERLKNGRLSLDEEFRVSEKAWRKGGSKMFVMVNSRVTVRDLLRGIIVQSGNDACIVIAEGLAGSEEAFAEAMTARGREIGLTNSVFKNSTGWPEEGHYMSAHDIATLSAKIIEEFPDYYPMFAEKTFTYGGIRQGNRNPLLYKKFGADGLKTGHTEDSGFGLAASVERDGRRLVLVVNGLSSMNERSSESARLLEWAFRETGSYALFGQGDTVDEAAVWLGEAAQVPLVLEKALSVTLPRRARPDMKVRLIYTNPVAAPVEQGAAIGQVVVTAPGQDPIARPLVAGETVERLGVFGRLGAALEYLLWGRFGT